VDIKKKAFASFIVMAAVAKKKKVGKGKLKNLVPYCGGAFSSPWESEGGRGIAASIETAERLTTGLIAANKFGYDRARPV